MGGKEAQEPEEKVSLRQLFKMSLAKEVRAGNTGKWPRDLASAQQCVPEDHWPSTHTGSR